MKKILSILASAIVALVVFAACNNTEVPYRELADAVKVANEKVQGLDNMLVDSTSITYDELTNTVKFTVVLPGKVNTDVIGATASDLKDSFIHNLVTNDEYDLCNPIINAHSNVIVSMGGREGKPYEILIEEKEIAEAKAALIEE